MKQDYRTAPADNRDCFVAGLLSQEKYSSATATCRGNHQLFQHQNFLCESSTQFFHDPAPSPVSCTVVGTPYWDIPFLQQHADKHGNASAVATAYRRYGQRWIDHIKGAFSFVLVDHDKDQLTAGIDRLGQFPLYHHQNKVGCFIGNRLGDLKKFDSVDFEITEQGVYNYIYFHMVPAPNTIYRNIHKLQAGHQLRVRAGVLSVERYWTPSFQESPSATFQEYRQQLKDRLGNSVSRASQTSKRCGTFLSGGLDSSSVTGAFSENAKGPAFSIGFSAEGYDEMAYARLTAKHFNTELVEYYVTPEDVVDALPKIAASYDEPFGNSSALPAYFCARLAAEHGIDCLLAGDGGDELFAGNERYAKQQLFSPYLALPLSLRQGVIEKLLNRSALNNGLIAKAKSYIAQANTPLPARLHTYNFLHQFQPQELFQAEFLKPIDSSQPGAIQQAIYDTPKDANEINRLLFLDWQFTLADNDLRKVSHMCELAGVKVQYPMLDDEMVEFSSRIPSRWKLKRNLIDSNIGLRHFYKKSFQGWLPEATINKSKQGFGLPFGVWMRTHKPLQEMAYDALTDMKQRNVFQPAFIDNAIKLHRQGHAAYYGELVWILMVLEFWLSQHQSQGRMERVA